jgi:RHS repeat-associated protein
MTTLDDVLDVGGPYRRLEFAYDWRSRRVSKKCFTGSPGSETVSDERRFVYDGWNLISEYEVVGGDLTIDRTYARGIDLSGTLQGAGGVGGLLSFDNGTSCFVPSYDGNGNLIGWMKDTGACVAVCEYDAFGRRVVCEELEAGGADCPIRFSSKYEDAETGLYYYGFRYYDPGTGRWMSKDPLAEHGALNLYEFIGNDATGSLDYLGLIKETRNAPSIWDHLPSSNTELGQEEWFEKVYPNLLAFARTLFSNDIDSWASTHCGGSPYPAPGRVIQVIPKFVDSNYRNWFPKRPEMYWVNEKDFGDRAMDFWEADKELGRFRIGFDAPVHINWTLADNLGYRTCFWTTEMWIKDHVGLDPSDPLYRFLESVMNAHDKLPGWIKGSPSGPGNIGDALPRTLFPKREVTRGRWVISGSATIYCDRTYTTFFSK